MHVAGLYRDSLSLEVRRASQAWRSLHPRQMPQWSGQKRPMVVGSKPANGCSPERGSFILVSPGQASPFSFSSSVARISVCDRGVAVGQAWR